MAKTKSKKGKKKEKAPKAGPLLNKVLTVCGAITTIANTAEGVHWVYEHAWPLIQPIYQSGLFCPEQFWWHGLAQPVEAGELPIRIKARLGKTLDSLRANQERIQKQLAHDSGSNRERISEAYGQVLSALREKYPHVISANVF